MGATTGCRDMLARSFVGFFAMCPRFPGGTTPGFPGGIETVVTLRLWGVGQQCPPAVAGPHGHHGWLHRARGVISDKAPVKDWGHCVLGGGCVVRSPSDQAHSNLDKNCDDLIYRSNK